MPKKHSGAYARNKGNAYERQVIKELTDLGYEGLKSSRSESKNLDNDKSTFPSKIQFLKVYDIPITLFPIIGAFTNFEQL